MVRGSSGKLPGFAFLSQCYMCEGRLITVSRRMILQAVCGATLFSLLGASASRTASMIRADCKPYLEKLRPFVGGPVLWRGDGSTPPFSSRMDCSAPDLLDPATYGMEGAHFFEELRQYTAPLDVASAHIGTGDVNEAAKWGEPVSVWPRGPLCIVYRENGKNIYKQGESVQEAFERRGKLVDNEELQKALSGGKEIMFETEKMCFYVVDRFLTPIVLAMLAVG